MRTLLVVLVAIATLVAPVAAVEIEVTTDPPLAAANLVQNPGIEQGADGQPAAWTFSTAVPENFTVGWAEGAGRNGSHALHLIAHDRVMSGYWGQSVQVQPGQYVFRGWYRTTGGRLLMYAHGRNEEADPPVGVDARTYHGSSVASFLVPVFIPYEALVGADPDVYYPFSVRVEIPEGLERVTLSMGMYFTPGEAWFDDVWFGPARVDMALRVSGEGEQIAKVVVVPEGSDEPVYSSEDDPSCPPGRPLAEPFDVTVEDIDMAAEYEIIAETADGDLHRFSFPGEAQ